MILDRATVEIPIPAVSIRETGAVLDGKYEILRRLTGGGMSEVYLVRHLHLDERRVIKVLRPEDAADSSAQARFLRAARTAAQIKHRNVAILYDYSSLPDGSFYMVWEYIDGEDVGRWIEKHGPFPLDVAVDLGVQALRGLGAIHSHGVIHRDISPDNLMLSQEVNGRVTLKIIDLGLAKNLSPQKPDLEVTQVGMFMGKLRYCSPEQAGMVEGAVLDHRSDLYSFAACFYEMLCGKAPFDSETSHGFVFKRLTEDPLPLAGRVPGVQIPAELDEIVRKGLERDRDRRFPTALRFIESLERVQRKNERFSTQQIVASDPPALPVRPASAGREPSRPQSARTSSQLSRQERDDLLAQINQASERVSRTRGILQEAEEGLSAGDLDRARRLLAEVEAIDPKAKGLEELKNRLQEMAAAPPPDERALETETMLVSYLEHHQVPLARLALESLLELAPRHSRRAEYEQRLADLSAVADQEQRADKALKVAREALSAGDFAGAERNLAAARRGTRNPGLGADLEAGLDRARQEQREADAVSDHKRRFEQALATGKLGEAERELASLRAANLPRLTLDTYRGQLEEARRLASKTGEIQAFEVSFARHVAAGDWFAAREVALEMEKVLDTHPRLAAMFAEADALRVRNERRQAIEGGERQVEASIAQGQADPAAMALKILLKIDPDHPRRKQLEKRIAAIRG